MKRKSTTRKPKIKVLVSDTTWEELTQIGSTPREVFIALSRLCPNQLRTLTDAKTQKLLKTISRTEIAQIAIRRFLEHSAPPTPAELASLRNPLDPAAQAGILARAVMHQHPETFRDVLQQDAERVRKSRPSEKRMKQLLIELTPEENENFRWFANQMGTGPSDLGGRLIECFAWEVSAELREHFRGEPKKHTK